MEHGLSFDPDNPQTSDDDAVTVFQLDGRPVRGRMARMGLSADVILGAHDYPVSVARLVGEAVLLAVLIGDSLKFEGKLIIQASGAGSQGQNVQGSGAVAFVVADYVPGEGVRAYAKYDAERVKTLESVQGGSVGVDMLLGGGHFVMTIDQGDGTDRYQGVTEIVGDSLAQSAEHYFAQSEQVPTRVKLSVGQLVGDEGSQRWRAGGALIQRIAGDDARGDAHEDFEHAQALFETIAPDELIDPVVTGSRLLYRLFHEDGVRVEASRAVMRRCTCEETRLKELLARFPTEDRQHMSRDDGTVAMTCEYCNREWSFSAADIDAVARAND